MNGEIDRLVKYVVKNDLGIIDYATDCVNFTEVGGGCINRSIKLSVKKLGNFFLKVNSSDKIKMFEAELRGLEELSQVERCVVPKVINFGVFDKFSYLLMEYVVMDGVIDERELATALRNMHEIVSDEGFGFYEDNFIGSNIQKNGYEVNWGDFFIKRRLRVQFTMAGLADMENDLDSFLELIRDFLNSLDIEASLLHGDLWKGNVSFSRDGKLVLYDPAVYYGDYLVDVAFTEMFGEFSPIFYKEYDKLASKKRDNNYELCKRIYNMYHELNHYNLFGGSYLSMVRSSIFYIRNFL